jgi:hypothetical protein
METNNVPSTTISACMVTIPDSKAESKVPVQPNLTAVY